MNVFDVMIVAVGLTALACVMIFLMARPGRKSRAEMANLLKKRPPQSAARMAGPGSASHASELGEVLPDHCVFISYRRADSADIVGRLYDHLTFTLGRDAVFKDVDSIKAGGDFRTQLDQSLNACGVFICVIGDRWAGPVPSEGRLIDDPNDFVRIEIETALRRKIPLIPLFVRGVRMPHNDLLPETLRDLAYRQGLPLRPDPDFRNDMGRLVASVLMHLKDK